MKGFPSILAEISDLTKSQVQTLLDMAFEYKDRPALAAQFSIPAPIIATSFLENSTRTKHSFEAAIRLLGCTHIDFVAEKSSLKKGETLEETFLTLHAQGIEACIIRTGESKVLEQFSGRPPIKIINGGDGTNAHPTQALLDLMTMIDIEGGIAGKTISIIGDLKHSRVTHSLVELLPQFGAKVILCGPENFLYRPDNDAIVVASNLEETIINSDIVYLLRIQFERHGLKDGDSNKNMLADYVAHYGLTRERFKKMGIERPIYHPGPVNIGVELSLDLMRSPLYRGYEQVRNSTFMRMAILKAIIENGDDSVGRLSRNVRS